MQYALDSVQYAENITTVQSELESFYVYNKLKF